MKKLRDKLKNIGKWTIPTLALMLGSCFCIKIKDHIMSHAHIKLEMGKLSGIGLSLKGKE